MSRITRFVTALSLCAAPSVTAASNNLSTDVALDNTTVLFSITNNLKVAAIPTAVTLRGSDGCELPLPVIAGAGVGAGQKGNVAMIPLGDLLASCVFGHIVNGVGYVSGVSGSKVQFPAPRKYGVMYTRAVPFLYEIEVMAADNSVRIRNTTSGHVYFFTH